MTGPGLQLPESDPRVAALKLLRPPAFFLLAVGIASLVLGFAALVTSAVGRPIPFGPQGSELTPPALDTRMGVALATWALCGLLAIWGSVNAMRLTRYGWTVVGAAAALMPLFPLCCMSLPVGIWMLVALRRPGIKSAFTP